MSIGSIKVGSTQDSQYGLVILPSLNIFASDDGTTWNLMGSLQVPFSTSSDVNYLNTSPHGFLTLNNLGINSSYVRVQAIANGKWTIIDEIQFSSPVPIPGAVWLLGSALLGLISVARRKSI